MMNERRPADLRVFLGSGDDEAEATAVAVASIRQHTPDVDLTFISRQSLGDRIYARPTTYDQAGRRWDLVSDAPMSTDHAIARFFVPVVCGYQGWALFADSDILCRRPLTDLLAYADPQYAVCCVQHPPLSETGLKKDGQIQTAYARKNWSSVMLFNGAHPSNRAGLTLDYLNRTPGRFLHAFAWLQAHEIGALPPEWNYLVGVTEPAVTDPAIVHFTLGLPSLPERAADPFAEEWRAVAARGAVWV